MLPHNKMIDRINELARKAKTVGLSNQELEEQKQLRQQYLQNFRSEFRKQLDSIQFVDEEDADGNGPVN